MKYTQPIFLAVLGVALGLGFSICQKLDRIGSALEAVAAATTYRHYDEIHNTPEKRRKLTAREDAFLSHHVFDCDQVAFIGYDNELHPSYCRP